MTVGLIPAVLLTVAVFAAFGLIEALRQYLDQEEL